MVRGVSTAIRASGCFNCRLSLLSTFTAISSIQPPQISSRPPRQRSSLRTQARFFSGSQNPFSQLPEDSRTEKISTSDNGDNQRLLEAQNPQLPWYLQVESPVNQPRSLSERQRIPVLPDSAPPILLPLLHQLSIDLGLDDLSLIDLRKVDPPPALGSNLLMVIGTARSEKHLHVSADRLCRWLRSDHKLRPDADGLLGRNELKLKMKRKNRRAKLLGSGASNDYSDDGIRTGWVCVNIGAVDGPAGVEEAEAESSNFVGFGRRTEGVKIVVQMLVEEKREELDLERLWNGIAKRRQFSDLDPEAEETSASGHISEVVNSSAAARLKASGLSHNPTTNSTSPMSVHSRGLHSSSGWMLSAAAYSAPLPAASQASVVHDMASNLQEVSLLLRSGDYDNARALIMDRSASVKQLQDERWKLHLRRSLKRHLESLPSGKALIDLGQGFGDQTSTKLLVSLYQTMSSFPSLEEWEFRVWLHCFARNLGHPGYTEEGLCLLFDDMRLSGVNISNDAYLKLLRTTIRPCEDSPPFAFRVGNEHQRILALEILQDMQDRTGNVLTEDVFLALQESLVTFGNHPEKLRILPDAATVTCDLPVLETPGLLRRLNTLMSTLQIKISSDNTRIRLMDAYAQRHDWEAFWKLWRSIAREGIPRSAALYARMFQLVAATNHQRGCMSVLRTWIPDMDREEVPVKFEGDVLEAVEACLAVADPLVDEARIYDPEVKGEWINLWRRCRDAV